MDFSFAEALRQLGPEAGFRFINEARASTDYLFETLLPEINKPNYHVESGFMTIRTTMAGPVGQSSPFPPGGAMEISTFLEHSAKIANSVTLEEGALRQIQEILMRLRMQGGDSLPAMVDEATNFYDKLIIQAHMDTAEYLRSQALRLGKIDWTWGDLHLLVNYGVPASFTGTGYTYSGTDSFDNTASKFWTAHYAALSALYFNVRAIIMHTTTWLKISANAVNNFQVNLVSRTNRGTAVYNVQRWVPRGSGTGAVSVLSSDFRDTLQIITYDLEGEVLDPNNPGKTLRVPFMPDGEILYVANNDASGYRVGEGATPDPLRSLALGYTHVAPTVEGSGRMGRWGRLFVPEMAPWSLRGEGVSNILPVREDVGPTLAKTFRVVTALS